ncbi:HAD-IB family hydrolase [Streptomyces sp. CMB-StM0423]|uniref:HAD-IB family hydrolase n=1 Tax=Streptomyces sp. CMB-StM0423 TaxID=2059884 RepID=UPI000C70F7E9|nr:HAD-IB family hydrolase [Streptomyces sp. CMB-StM0423]AUH44122.1 HAD-IB family hydrolase [Streptomyces sp. CMB-StM0423]
MTGTYRIGRLDDAHVLLTGATGFIGQALLERLLSGHPGTRVSIVVRPRGNGGAADRFRRLLRKDVFRTWREQVGDEAAFAEAERRVTVIEGALDKLEDVEFPADIDVAIHCASSVSFDPPIDEAFRSNVSGAVALYEKLGRQERPPHIVHISTAYVSSGGQGLVREGRLTHDVDWRGELAQGLAARDDVERASRRPEVLRKALEKAGRDHGKAGPQIAAKDAEDARRAWVEERLVEHGAIRAEILGFSDVYTFTKAMSERAVEELWADRPLSIVRPAIVESALRHPYPGWIDGFKMADPLIIAYGSGLLRDMPGQPDTVMDVVPVDLVVNATLAAAAAPPEEGAGPHYFHVGSGATNPLTLRDLYKHVHSYFRRDPLPESSGRGHVRPPTWTFPGAARVEFALGAGERAANLADKLLGQLPGTERTQEWASRLHKEKRSLETLRRYSDLYGVYTRTAVVYDDRELRALNAALPADRAAEHGFDPAEIDWYTYLEEVHCPKVTAPLRARTGGGRKTRKPNPAALPPGGDVAAGSTAAVFDLDGTIIASDIVESYVWTRLASLPRGRWAPELFDLARNAPRYLLAERRDRGDVMRTFFRRYEGARAEELRALVAEQVGDALLHRVMPEAVRRIRAHRAAGHRTVLITGSLDLLVEPLRPLFDDIEATHLAEHDGVLTGFLRTPPIVGEGRAAWLQSHAREREIHLGASFGYADSYSDRPLLEVVGKPHAVNPDTRLFRHAKRHRWEIARWGTHTASRWDALAGTVISHTRPRPVRALPTAGRTASDGEAR